MDSHEINEIAANVKSRIETDIKREIGSKCVEVAKNLVEHNIDLNVSKIMHDSVSKAMRGIDKEIERIVGVVIDKKKKDLLDGVRKQEVIESVAKDQDFLISIVERLNKLQVKGK